MNESTTVREGPTAGRSLCGSTIEETALRVHTPGQIAWRRFRRHRPAVVSIAVLAIIAILAVGVPVLGRHNPIGLNLKDMTQPPSAQHWLGTDHLGRDLWSRAMYGGRVSLAVGIAAAALSTIIGMLVGSTSGYYGGKVDMVLMRLTDVMMTFPPIIIMLTFAAVVGPGIWNVIWIIGGLRWPATTRLVRGQVLALKRREFVVAARAIGATDRMIIVRHILPNVVAPLVARITFAVSGAILAEAGLSFLGMGVPLPTPTWGNMMEPARNLTVLRDEPWMWMPPAFLVLLTILCINFIGDGLRDALDPQQII